MKQPTPLPDRVLLVVAAPAEARSAREALFLTDAPKRAFWQLEPTLSGIDLIETGVGKAQAAAGTAATFDPTRHAGAISIGIGGSYPESGLEIGDRVLASSSSFADDGVQTPTGFEPIERVGFPPARFGQASPINPAWERILTPIVNRIGGVATVSSCSGTADQARAIETRTGAIAEAMEGAAVAAAVAGAADPISAFAELRVISNTTGDRDRQVWDLPRSLKELRDLVADITELQPQLVEAVRTGT